jgi:hypothetical protein
MDNQPSRLDVAHASSLSRKRNSVRRCRRSTVWRKMSLDALAVLRMDLEEGVRVMAISSSPNGRGRKGCCIDGAPAVHHRDQVADVLGDETGTLFAFAQALFSACARRNRGSSIPPDDTIIEHLGLGIALENAPVVQLDGVEAFWLGCW